MPDFTRRKFLQSSLASASLSIGLPANAASHDQIRHAVIGVGGQGRAHCKAFSRLNELCQVVALCDVDPQRREQALSQLPSREGTTKVKDYRRILDDDSIDSISIATPDHWHAKIAVEAILAGKHVYVEKPCCHNVHEGHLLVQAARKYNKCVQHGTQSRSGEGIQQAVQFMREEKLGKIRLAKAINHQFRKPIGTAKVQEPPAGVDYDLWLGPAPKHAFTKNRWHYNWHWFWDYGTGDIGNDGIHQVDVARWGLGVGFPHAISASGGQLFYQDDHETPDTQLVTYEYEDCFLVFEMRLWTDYPLEGHDNGTVFYGDKGKLEVGRKGCFVTFVGEKPKKIGGGADLEAHVKNFLECVRENNPQGLNAPIEEGFQSASLCHFGNIATRVDRKLKFDTQLLQFVDDQQANILLTRKYRHGYEFPRI